MNPYTELYKSLSNSELLIITNSQGDYQSLAIEAATIELANRQLTDLELSEAIAENGVRLNQKKVQKENKKAFENKLKTVGISISDTLNPIQKGPFSTNKTILIISIAFCILFLFQFINQFGLIKYMLTNSEAIWGFEMVIYFLPLFIAPVAGYLF